MRLLAARAAVGGVLLRPGGTLAGVAHHAGHGRLWPRPGMPRAPGTRARVSTTDEGMRGRGHARRHTRMKEKAKEAKDGGRRWEGGRPRLVTRAHLAVAPVARLFVAAPLGPAAVVWRCGTSAAAPTDAVAAALTLAPPHSGRGRACATHGAATCTK